jgi:hypothetical protein
MIALTLELFECVLEELLRAQAGRLEEFVGDFFGEGRLNNPVLRAACEDRRSLTLPAPGRRSLPREPFPQRGLLEEFELGEGGVFILSKESFGGYFGYELCLEI